ncbi:MAG TPA: phosphate acyltransferase PlsX [Bacillota bacterium]|nr:phosphate acyltransferase PlsX [Bacillota bacterium]
MRVVVDAMGGDYAPREVVKGAVQAAREYKWEILLVGPSELIKQELAEVTGKKPGDSVPGISIINADEVIEMNEHPAQAVRRKKNSSIVVGVKLVKEGQGDAFVSAGNTGAAMAASLLAYRPIAGIDRPAIASVMPTVKGATLVLDVGANADCKPHNLAQFGIMGQIYANKILGVAKPTVGLLNIGEEETKGNELSQAAFNLMRNWTGLNFIGNVEGRDIIDGKADVVVCDGFVGNVVLKFAEGLAKGLLGMIKEGAMSSLRGKLGGLLLKPALGGLKKKMDYTEYGGAPLLGLNGICIISHGSSNAHAIKNAIRVAGECVENRIVQAIKESIDNYEAGGVS